MRIKVGSAFVAAGLLLVGACGGDDGGEGATTTAEPTTASVPTETTAASTAAPSGHKTLKVPEDFETIQKAVDAASPGDLILIAEGVYKEAVDVTTDELTIRGLDRNKVILEGDFKLDNGIRVLGAKGVAVENMTARNYTTNGFFWTGVEGYRGSYLTAYRNGDYGVYAFDSVKGQLDHDYASGSPDAGFYVGQCYPCEAVIDHVVSEHNGLGYSGTNSGGNLIIVNSVFRYNRAGVVPNSGSYELCYPERDTTIVGNTIYSNNQTDTPAIRDALLAMGNGILTPGGVGNVIERNLVYDHDLTGIGIVPYLEADPNDNIPGDDQRKRPCSESKQDPPPDPAKVPPQLLWEPRENVVRGNVIRDSRLADIAIGTIASDPAILKNCFSGNNPASSAPKALETLAPCEGTGTGSWTDGALDLVTLLAAEHPPAGDFKTTPVPPDQDNMPNAMTAPPRPATDVPAKVDLAAIKTPTAPPSK